MRYSTKGKSAPCFQLVLVLSIFCLLASCHRDDEDDGPIFIPKELYQIEAELHELNEIPCLDSVPGYDPAQVGSYDFAFEDSVFIEHIVMNPNNSKQWVFSKRYVFKDQPYGIGTEAVYWTDLSTGECKLIDSTENLGSLVYGGNYVVLELNTGCLLYQVSSGKSTQIEGIQPSISPNGKWLKLYMYKDFSNQREDLFKLSDMTVSKSWERIGGVAPNRVLWLDDNKFIFYRSKAHGDTYELREYDLVNDEYRVLYAIQEYELGLWPVIRFDDDNVVTKWGVQVDLANKTHRSLFPEYCKNKYFDQFISIGKDGEFIGKKAYFRADHEAKVVYYSHHFHLLKPDEGVEQRLKLVFDEQ